MSRRRARLARSAALAATALLTAGCGSTGTGSSGGGATDATPGQGTALAGAPSWCGEKKITMALADGFGANNWQRVTRAEAADEVSKCPSVTSFDYSDGQNNTQKGISDIQGFVAKGVDALVVFPHQGKAMLPAIRSAYKAGVVTVPYRVSPEGNAGQDYDVYVDTDFAEAGELWGDFLVQALPQGGKVLQLGGPAANSQSLAEHEGMMEVLSQHPNIEVIGQQPYEVTDWDPAKTQQVVTAALARYPQIDAIATDFGSALASAFPAFEQAGRQIPIIATEDSNQLACDWRDAEAAGKEFGLFTVDSQNGMVRLAVQQAVARATGGVVPDSATYPQAAWENSLTGSPNPVLCDESLPPDAFTSAGQTLTTEQQIAALK